MPAKSLALLTALLLLPSFPGRAELERLDEEPEPTSPGIPEVASQEELDALKPLTYFEGWELRLALAPGTMPEVPRKEDAAPDFKSTPWRILYADFRRTEKDARFPHAGEIRDGEPIGLLDFKLDFDPDARFDHVLKDIMRMERMDILREDSDLLLFAATLPAAAKGSYRLRVYPPLPKRKPDADPERKDLIAESIWKQEAPIPVQWFEFAKSTYVDLPDLGIPTPDKMSTDFIPYAPKFDEHQSLIDSGGRLKIKEVPKAGGATPIPGMIPAKPDPGFKISLSGAGIAIALEEPASTEIENFLARWWIDGKPAAWTFDEMPPRRLEDELKQMARALENEKVFTTRIPFRTPHAFKDLDADSKITLQLLYSPTGTKELPNPEREEMLEELREMRALFERNDLRLSNRLEFKFGDVIDPE